MARLTYDLNVAQAGNQAFLNFLTILQLDARKFNELQTEIGLSLRENTLLRFVDEVDPAGNPWKRSQRAELQGGQTLNDTGALKSSITFAVNGNTVEVGTNLEYAEPLHYGATIRPQSGDYLRVKGAYGWFTSKEITLPAREFLGVSDEDEESIGDVIRTFLAELAQ